MSTVILYCSSDNTVDIARQTVKSFELFWPDCPFQKYLLLTTEMPVWPVAGWHMLTSGKAEGWRAELLLGLNKLPPKADSIILFLDDFFITRMVDTNLVLIHFERFRAASMNYLRLKPVDRSWAMSAAKRLLSYFFGSGVEALTITEPYYSSLQLALWRCEHLKRLLAETPDSIWKFEHLVPAEKGHYAITGRKPINYIHVVERGRWLPYTKHLFRRAGIELTLGTRRQWHKSYILLHYLRKIRFGLFGYSIMRLKQLLTKQP